MAEATVAVWKEVLDMNMSFIVSSFNLAAPDSEDKRESRMIDVLDHFPTIYAGIHELESFNGEWHSRFTSIQRYKPLVRDRMWGLVQAYHHISCGPFGILRLHILHQGRVFPIEDTRDRLLLWWNGKAIEKILAEYVPEYTLSMRSSIVGDLPISRALDIIKDAIQQEVRSATEVRP